MFKHAWFRKHQQDVCTEQARSPGRDSCLIQRWPGELEPWLESALGRQELASAYLRQNEGANPCSMAKESPNAPLDVRECFLEMHRIGLERWSHQYNTEGHPRLMEQ